MPVAILFGFKKLSSEGVAIFNNIILGRVGIVYALLFYPLSYLNNKKIGKSFLFR